MGSMANSAKNKRRRLSGYTRYPTKVISLRIVYRAMHLYHIHLCYKRYEMYIISVMLFQLFMKLSSSSNIYIHIRMILPIHAASIPVNKATSKRLVKKTSSFHFILSPTILWEQSVEWASLSYTALLSYQKHSSLLILVIQTMADSTRKGQICNQCQGSRAEEPGGVQITGGEFETAPSLAEDY